MGLLNRALKLESEMLTESALNTSIIKIPIMQGRIHQLSKKVTNKLNAPDLELNFSKLKSNIQKKIY